jgi:hypothetical protein
LFAVEFDDWSADEHDMNSDNHIAFSYSPNGFVCTRAMMPRVFVHVDPAVADFHNQEPPPATPNRFGMTLVVQSCRSAGGRGAVVACDLEAIDRGVSLGRLFTHYVRDFVPFEGYLGVTATTSSETQNHLLHSARLERLPSDFCLEPAASAVRSIAGTRNVVDNCGDFLAGDELSVTLTLESVRLMSECCGAPASITVRDAPPAGWTVVPGSITGGGMVMSDEVVWTVANPSEGQTLSYRVMAADSPGTVVPWGAGSVVENVVGSTAVAITGQSQLLKDTPFDDCGGIKCWSIAGTLRQPGGAAPGPTEILRDFLTDGVVSDVVFRMAPGDEIAPDFDGAAASRDIFNDPKDRNPRRAEGIVTVFPWNDADAFINLSDDVFSGRPNYTVSYAAVRVIAEEEMSDIHLAVSSDDSIRVVLNGQEVHSHNVSRGGSTVCAPQDTRSLVTLQEGVNDLRLATFQGSGDWNFALRFQDAVGNPITRGLEVSKTADLGCRRPPVVVTRSVHTVQTVRVGSRLRPAYSRAGRTYTVTLAVADPRPAGESCSAAGQVTITDLVPPGWTPRLPSLGGRIDGREVSWTVAAAAAELSYQVTTGGAAVDAPFAGSVRDSGGGGGRLEPSAFNFSIRGNTEVVYVPEPFSRGTGQVAVNENFNAGAEKSCPEGWTCNATGGPPLAPFVAGIAQQFGHVGRLRLANTSGNIASSVIYNDVFDLSSSSFIAEFVVFFRQVALSITPADGLTFCVLDAGDPDISPASLGAAGGSMGYGGLNGFAVEFDLWDNGAGPTGYNNAANPFGHVALIRDGRVLPHVQTHFDLDPDLRPRRLGGAGFPYFVDFLGSGAPLYCEVDYNNGRIQVFLSAPATFGGVEREFPRTKVLDTVVLFPSQGGGAGLGPGLEPLQNVYFGFTAGTSHAGVIHEVDNFSLTVFPGEREPEGPLFVRGDSDANGTLETTDAVRVLGFLFLGGSYPAPACLDAADADDNGCLDLTDAVRILGYLFLGGASPPPALPSPSIAVYPPEDCGPDSVRIEEPDLGCATESTTCTKDR